MTKRNGFIVHPNAYCNVCEGKSERTVMEDCLLCGATKQERKVAGRKKFVDLRLETAKKIFEAEVEKLRETFEFEIEAQISYVIK